jgi:hypothetical protein
MFKSICLLLSLISPKVLAVNDPGGGDGGPEGVFDFDLPAPGEGLPTTLPDLLERVTAFAQNISIIIAGALYLWAAFLYLTSGGEPARIKQANRAVLYTTVGLIVVLLAHGLAIVIKNILAPELPVPPSV